MTFGIMEEEMQRHHALWLAVFLPLLCFCHSTCAQSSAHFKIVRVSLSSAGGHQDLFRSLGSAAITPERRNSLNENEGGQITLLEGDRQEGWEIDNVDASGKECIFIFR